MTAFRLVAAIVVALVMGVPAHAQTVHRMNVPAGDAVPTGGSFSIRFPTPFSDVEMKAEDPSAPTVVVRMVTGISTDHIRFSATEMPFEAGNAQPMESFMEGTKKRPGAAISDVHRESGVGTEILSFALADATGGYFFRMVRANDIQYMQVIQFPESQRAKATEMKDDFFNSFKITR